MDGCVLCLCARAWSYPNNPEAVLLPVSAPRSSARASAPSSSSPSSAPQLLACPAASQRLLHARASFSCCPSVGRCVSIASGKAYPFEDRKFNISGQEAFNPILHVLVSFVLFFLFFPSDFIESFDQCPSSICLQIPVSYAFLQLGGFFCDQNLLLSYI